MLFRFNGDGWKVNEAMDAEIVRDAVKKDDVRFVELWFTDTLGFLKAVTIKASDVEDYIETGIGIDGSSVPGFVGIESSDMIAMPDPSTFRIIPWYEGAVTGRMFCDIMHPGGQPFEGDPRGILKRTLARAKEMGFEYVTKPELEYFYFEDLESRTLIDRGKYMDLPPFDAGVDLRQETIMDLQAMGVDVDFSHHEAAPGQNEIEVKMTDSLTTADTAMTYRQVVKEVARKQGVIASFMPKPLAGVHGSGMHVHQKLYRDGRNAFHDDDGEFGLSKTALQFIAGTLRHSREITMITNQWTNSYKRLMSGFEAPVHIVWGSRNRSALIRVPGDRLGDSDSTRVEYRAPDPAANPYLMLSVMLTAGLEGIEKGYDPIEPIDFDVHTKSKDELAELGHSTLPQSLGEAIGFCRESELVRNALGDHTMDWLLDAKESEWSEYQRHVTISVITAEVTDFELKKFLPVL